MKRHVQPANTLLPLAASHLRPRLRLLAIALVIGLGGASSAAMAEDPCGELSECLVRIEINATDGDIGFQAGVDADGWKEVRITDPDGQMIFHNHVTGRLRDQNLTELAFESAELVCEESLAGDEDDPVLTLPEFLERFPAGAYDFRVKLLEWDKKGGRGHVFGSAELTHLIPPAPTDLAFDGSVVSWTLGDDLGVCTTASPGFELATEADLAGYEVVVEALDPAFSDFEFTTQVPVGVNAVTVPLEFLAALPADTPLKIEVGAIERRADGSFGNQTFSEEDGFCSNVDQTLCPVPTPTLAPAAKIAPEPVSDVRPRVPGSRARIQ